ncbi:MAG: hypothetical protein J6K89_07465 [Oscillospiraceae bacterium]|nr:hypothetical protein [Oscillospiraceae bacterium]
MRDCKIDVSTGFLAFICAYAFFDPLNSFVVFVFSVVCHELAHIAVAVVLKKKVYEIFVGINGCQIRMDPMDYKQELLVAVAGPFANFILFMIGARLDPLLCLTNLVLLGYNLLPIYPLDGGRILRGILRIMIPITWAELVEKLCVLGCFSVIVYFAVYLCCVLHAGLWPVLLCGFLIYRLGETILPNYNFLLDKLQIPW